MTCSPFTAKALVDYYSQLLHKPCQLAQFNYNAILQKENGSQSILK
jgi:hypothetical protein